MDIEKFVKEGSLRRIEPSPQLSSKEFKEANYDLGRAEEALKNRDFKWAIVKSYYSMFHAAKCILFLLGLKEKAHFVVGEVLEMLSKEGKLEAQYVDDFRAGMSCREGADYHYDYSEESARQVVGMAKEFVNRMKRLRSELE
jgi:uncharacterized protein (UPF0332 family)